MARILVIEDDYTQLDIIEQGLAFHGHVIDTKGDGAEGLEQLLAHHYDLAIIDWDLPGLQGVDVCNKYRNSGGTAAVLFLTGKSSVTNKVQAFDCGADDYLTKPFSYAELLARVKALLRRPHTMESESLVYQEITLDMVTKVATVSGKDIGLTPGEFSLLELFVKNPGRLFNAAELLDRVFKSETDQEAVRQRVMRLRKKLAVQGKEESRITTQKGFGYKFE
ncbi:MAG TPA: response regulator transcription factor [Candidatus Melainabacteria bacterium]|nr:response regulator transcription factor [Candidatus Melainabacteria bacterium]